MQDSGNLFRGLPGEAQDELFDTLMTANGVTVERIVSTGQATPEGEWYDQDQHELVVLISGQASVRFEDEDVARWLAVGDWLWIPARARHRVESTKAEPVTVWLAVFIPPEA